MRKFIIDTDAGVDDAVALAMALDAHRHCSYPCFAEVEGIGTWQVTDRRSDIQCLEHGF